MPSERNKKPVDPTVWSPKELLVGRSALLVMVCIWYASGWIILREGSFQHQLAKYSKESVTVDGPVAIAMSLMFFALAFIAVAILVKNIWKDSRIQRIRLQLCWIVMLIPIFFAKA
jgi:uncharacterized membrane protein